MRHKQFAILVVALCSQLVLAQSATYRVGDVFRGPVKTVRSERTYFVREGDREIESTPTLLKLTTYTPDGLSRESISYNANGSTRERYVERYRSDGNRIDVSVFGAKDKLISRTAYEYNDFGLPVSETRYNPDGSVKELKFIESTRDPKKIIAHTKIGGNGNQIERAVNNRDESSKTSQWSYSKPDGSRREDNFSRDEAGNHITESLSYGPDGSLTARRVSKVDRGVTRLEATEYDGHGNVLKKTFETREYDSRRNLIKFVNYRWNAELQKFEPVSATYHHITYFK